MLVWVNARAQLRGGWWWSCAAVCVCGSAWCRRQRRLRSMGRFVAQPVRVALATTSHHSHDSHAGVCAVRAVDFRVGELELKHMLETDLLSRIASVERLVKPCKVTSRRVALLPWRLGSLLSLLRLMPKLRTLPESCCGVADRFDSQVATLAESCQHSSALVATLEEQASDCDARLAYLAVHPSQLESKLRSGLHRFCRCCSPFGLARQPDIPLL